MGPGWVQLSRVHLPVGPRPIGAGVLRVRWWLREEAWWSELQLLKLALRTWNATPLMRKKLELVRKVEGYWLDVVGLTSTHSMGSGVGLDAVLM